MVINKLMMDGFLLNREFMLSIPIPISIPICNYLCLCYINAESTALYHTIICLKSYMSPLIKKI